MTRNREERQPYAKELDDYAHESRQSSAGANRTPATSIANEKNSGTTGAEAGVTETGVGKNAYRPPW